MLGRNYRFVVYNGTGQTLGSNPISIKARRWNFSSSGVQTWEGSEATVDSTIGNGLTNATYSAGTAVDNSTTAYLGGTFRFSVTAPTSANGQVIIYLQNSSDGGTTWPDNGFGRVIKVFNFTTSGIQGDDVEL
jgi:hypothetical protein